MATPSPSPPPSFPPKFVSLQNVWVLKPILLYLILLYIINYSTVIVFDYHLYQPLNETGTCILMHVEI